MANPNVSANFLQQCILYVTSPGGLITVVSLALALYQTWRSREFKKMFYSRRYLKKIAMQFYKDGKYDDCLDAFEKYYLNNNEKGELYETINSIFWMESRKIYGDQMPQRCNDYILISIILSIKEEIKAEYPDFLYKIINMLDSCVLGEERRPHLAMTGCCLANK